MASQARWSALVAMTVLLGSGDAGAICTLGHGGFAVFQCGNEAAFGTAPFPITLDPNSRPSNVTSLFWQIGFGNAIQYSGGLGDGTGMNKRSLLPPAPVFNGNDSGILPIDVVSFSAATGDASPSNALCVRSADWINWGVDGCADNWRLPADGCQHDGVLNPYFDDYQFNCLGYAGYYSRNSIQDYPMAILLKGPAQTNACDRSPDCVISGVACDLNNSCNSTTHLCSIGPRAGLGCTAPADCNACSNGPRQGEKCGSADQCHGCSSGAFSGVYCTTEIDCDFCPNDPARHCGNDNQCADDSGATYFAFAAVASMARNNNPPGTNGNCISGFPYSGNPAPCDFRPGHFDFASVSNGLANVNVPGKANVVPWQAVPTPQSTSVTCANPGVTPSILNVSAQWDGVETYTDQSVRPSTHSMMGGASFAAGTGVKDIMDKFSGLVRYVVEKRAGAGAPSTVQETFEDPNRLSSDPNPTLSTTLQVNESVRIRTVLGKKPQTALQVLANCAVGKCGDIGYEADSAWVSFSSDTDGDSVDAVCGDNCLTEFNPDQLNSDGEGDGDVCDPCPADATNTCAPGKTEGVSIGPAGGTVATPDGTVSLQIPAGSLSAETSMSTTSIGSGTNFQLGDTFAITAVTINKAGTTFSPPATVTFTWTDNTTPGTVDGTSVLEADLKIFKNGVDISGSCSSSVSCDTSLNTFSVAVSSLSQFVLGVLSPAGAGEVPDGDSVPGGLLSVVGLPNGDLSFSWSASCSPADTDYEIYEGTLGQFASHIPRQCSTGGATNVTLTPGAGSRYYLVAARNASREGSLGRRSNGLERPQGPAPCLPRGASTCN